jgi:hypothetical protein
MSNDPVDLNKLRDIFVKNAAKGKAFPENSDEKVYVDDEGGIVVGSDAGGKDPRRLSEVHQATFAAVASARLASEREIVREKLPSSTSHVDVDGVSGWFYSFVSELNDEYTMFLYWDEATGLYKVKLVFPEVDLSNLDPHREHLFSNGNICLAEAIGLPTLEKAYAKSVLFANAWSFHERGHGFPFSPRS